MLLRLGFSLAVVVGVMYLAARVARQRGALAGAPAGRGPMLRVLSRQALGKSSSVAVVNIGDRNLVVGVTPTHVSLLAEVDATDVEEVTESSGIHWTETLSGESPEPSRMGIVGQLRELTVRRR